MTQTYQDFNQSFDLKSKVGFDLSSFQVQDVNQFAEWGRSANFYEVGGGKTVVSSITSLVQGFEHTIVIVPPILIPPWVRWLRSLGQDVCQYDGSPAKRAKLNPAKHRWAVMSHAIFRQEVQATKGSRRIFNDYVNLNSVEVIVDEAHALKNIKSELFKAVRTFSDDSSGRGLQLLTGTPTNSPLDAYAYISMLTPGVYRSHAHFTAVHVKGVDLWGRPTGYLELDEISHNLHRRAITRTKEEVHGYNMKPLWPDGSYDLSKQHYDLYTKMVDECLLAYPDGTVLDLTSVNKLRHALQRVILNWSIYAQKDGLRPAAYDLLDQTLDEIDVTNVSKSKLLIWVNYKDSNRTVTDYINSKGIKCVAAYSETDTRKAVDAFMDDPATRVLVGHYKSVGAGLNPQHVCWESLFLELSTEPLAMRQAIGRIDRVGQKHQPRLKFAVAEGTVQKHLLDNLLKNDDLLTKVEPTKKAIRAMLLGQ
jgi:SNF2 family DNA or RNA helicase